MQAAVSDLIDAWLPRLLGALALRVPISSQSTSAPDAFDPGDRLPVGEGAGGVDLAAERRRLYSGRLVPRFFPTLGRGPANRLFSVALLLATLALAAPGIAQARNTSYCSSTGDLCYGQVRGVRPVALQIDLFAKYFARYSLCVQRPGRKRVCKSFRIRKRGSLYGSRVSWRRYFPHQGHGGYRARWRQSGRALGPTIHFRG